MHIFTDARKEILEMSKQRHEVLCRQLTSNVDRLLAFLKQTHVHLSVDDVQWEGGLCHACQKLSKLNLNMFCHNNRASHPGTALRHLFAVIKKRSRFKSFVLCTREN